MGFYKKKMNFIKKNKIQVVLSTRVGYVKLVI